MFGTFFATPKSAYWHMTETSFNSPWVSVTVYQAVAEKFAITKSSEDPPSGTVMRLLTSRYTVPSAVGGPLSIKEGEELLFLRLGIPLADYIEEVYPVPQ